MKRFAKTSIATLFMAVVVLSSAGCSDNPVESTPKITGQWTGTTTLQGLTFTVAMQIVENEGNVNANGTLTYVEPVAVSATGTYNFPSVSMTIRSTGFQDLNFNGTLSAGGNALTGSMSGSSTFDNFSITLTRQ